MTKAKFKSPGVIKVTMTDDQYIAIAAILQHVRMGGDNYLKRALGDYLKDLDAFNREHLLDDVITEIADDLEFIHSQSLGMSINLRAEEE